MVIAGIILIATLAYFGLAVALGTIMCRGLGDENLTIKEKEERV